MYIRQSNQEQAYRVRVTPVSRIRSTCFTTSSTGSTGALHEMKTTAIPRESEVSNKVDVMKTRTATRTTWCIGLTIR